MFGGLCDTDLTQVWIRRFECLPAVSFPRCVEWSVPVMLTGYKECEALRGVSHRWSKPELAGLEPKSSRDRLTERPPSQYDVIA